jgi:hypothetical protein
MALGWRVSRAGYYKKLKLGGQWAGNIGGRGGGRAWYAAIDVMSHNVYFATVIYD